MRVANWLLSCILCATATLSAEVLDVPGARLYYSDAGGENTPVVLLHAASGSSRNWVHQQDAFRAAGYRIIAYDRRGWGRTEVSSEAKAVSAADDLLALADHLKLGRFHLLGVAAGGI